MSDSISMLVQARDLAMEKGAREFNIRGQRRMAYGLTKDELYALFMQNRYNVTTGSRWRSTITEWVDKRLYNNILTVSPDLILDKQEKLDWSIVFFDVDRLHMNWLLMAAENNNIQCWPSMRAWEDVVGCTQ